MVISRKQRLADILNGRALAAWLNRQDDNGLTVTRAKLVANYLSEKSPVKRREMAKDLNVYSDSGDVGYFLAFHEDVDNQDPRRWTSQIIGMYVAYQQVAIEYGVVFQDLIRTIFSMGFMGRMLPEEASKGTPASPEDLQERLRKGSSCPLKVRAEFRPWGHGVEFKIVPEDEHSRMLYLFIQLVNSGDVSRLRFCPNCEKFWYCTVRADKRFCSDACKVSFWQKTARGKETKKQYMKRYREDQRERLKKSALTANRHKIARGILANLGK
jgi:hypothetical protein